MPGEVAANMWPGGNKLADESRCIEKGGVGEFKEPGPLKASPAIYTLGLLSFLNE